MKPVKRTAKLIRNLVLLALLAFVIWAGWDFAPVDKLGRLREQYMLAELEPLYEGFENELICDAGEHYAMVTYGRSLRAFMEKSGDIAAFPAASLVPGSSDDVLLLYAVGEVPGAAYAEAEVRIDYYKGYEELEPWVETYQAQCEYADGLAKLTIRRKWTAGRGVPGAWRYVAAESLAFGNLGAELFWTLDSPACYATLRYYAGDGTLLAQRDVTVVPEWDKETYHIGDLP